MYLNQLGDPTQSV